MKLLFIFGELAGKKMTKQCLVTGNPAAAIACRLRPSQVASHCKALELELNGQLLKLLATTPSTRHAFRRSRSALIARRPPKSLRFLRLVFGYVPSCCFFGANSS